MERIKKQKNKGKIRLYQYIRSIIKLVKIKTIVGNEKRSKTKWLKQIFT